MPGGVAGSSSNTLGRPRTSARSRSFSRRGCSSVGRAPRSQCGGRRFDPGHLHRHQKVDRFRIHLSLWAFMRARKSRAACPGCGGVVENLDSTYCSNTCQNDCQYRAYIERWLTGEETGNMPNCLDVCRHVRRYLFERAKNACEQCGWSKVHPVTGRVPLTINHKDGNWRNSGPVNLELLCPNCHSLTPNYGALNKGQGTKRRRGVPRRVNTRLAKANRPVYRPGRP